MYRRANGRVYCPECRRQEYKKQYGPWLWCKAGHHVPEGFAHRTPCPVCLAEEAEPWKAAPTPLSDDIISRRAAALDEFKKNGGKLKPCINGHPATPEVMTVVHPSKGKPRLVCQVCARLRSRASDRELFAPWPEQD